MRSSCRAGFSDEFALGAATGIPAILLTPLQFLLDGYLTATVSSPPVTVSGTQSAFGSTSVIGPGQNASIIFFAFRLLFRLIL